MYSGRIPTAAVARRRSWSPTKIALTVVASAVAATVLLSMAGIALVVVLDESGVFDQEPVQRVTIDNERRAPQKAPATPTKPHEIPDWVNRGPQNYDYNQYVGPDVDVMSPRDLQRLMDTYRSNGTYPAG